MIAPTAHRIMVVTRHMHRWSGRIFIAIGTVIFLFGVGITPVWLAMGWIGGASLSATEFPLGDPVDVAVDSEGHVYVADGYYKRIQRYTADGRFERGWQVPGVIGVRATEDDLIEVATRSASTVRVFRPDGTVARQFRADDIWSYSPDRKPRERFIVVRELLPRVIIAGFPI